MALWPVRLLLGVERERAVFDLRARAEVSKLDKRYG